jgi:hypothetical protein
MKHPHLYYALGMGVIFCTVIPLFITWWMVSTGKAKECNTLVIAIFDKIGIAPALIILTLILIGAVLLLPVSFKPIIEKWAWAEYVLIGLMALALILHSVDTLNDLAVIFNSPVSNATLAILHTGNILIKPQTC